MTTALASTNRLIASEVAGGEASYLLCVVRGAILGVAANAVREIVPLPEITRVGEASSNVEGVVDVRGRIAPVFDIASALGFAPQPPQPGDALVVLEQDGELCAFAVDALRDVQPVVVQESATPSKNELVAGLAQIEEGIAQILRLDALFRRTANIGEATEANSTVLPHRFLAIFDEERAVFRARAVSLRRTEEDVAAEQTLPLAAVELNGEYFGFDLDLVREFAPLRSFAPVPFAPRSVIGLANLRGETLTLVDLRFAVQIPAPANWTNAQIVVVELHALRVGIVVDLVLDVFAPPLSSVAASTRDENLRGTVPYRDSMMGILDVARVLDAVMAKA